MKKLTNKCKDCQTLIKAQRVRCKNCHQHYESKRLAGSKKVKCLVCNTEFNKIASQIKRSPNHFCSRSCSAKFNNRKTRSRMKPQGSCKKCGSAIQTKYTYCSKCTPVKIGDNRGVINYCHDCRIKISLDAKRCKGCYDKHKSNNQKTFKNCNICNKICRGKRCQSCYNQRNKNKQLGMTIFDLHNSLSVKDKHPSWKSSYIRLLNRTWNKELLTKPCANCDYDKHVELAHIRAISDFPPTATLGEVNAKENVIQLCPNCHWEFDNNQLDLNQRRSKS